MNKIFYEQISEDDAMLMFSHLGLTSLQDCRWFRKSDIRGQVMEKMMHDLAMIEPYYLPHKKFLCYREQTPQRLICILRHIAKSRDMWLETQEKARFGKKEIFYRLRTNDKPIIFEHILTFD